MRELSLHLLDVAENAVRAGASLIEITVAEDTGADTLTLAITDNGAGMDKDMLARAEDPFFTTKGVRRVGLGVPMLARAARAAGGSFTIASEPGKGTVITAVFGCSHLDRQPLGDLAGAIAAIVTGKPDMDIVLACRKDECEYCCDTRQFRDELGDIALNHPEVLGFLRKTIQQGLAELKMRS